MTAVRDLRGGIQEAGNSKTQKNLNKLSGGRFDFPFLLGIHFFNFSSQFFVHFLNLFDVFLFAISAFLS